jgi:hypothetical protein
MTKIIELPFKVCFVKMPEGADLSKLHIVVTGTDHNLLLPNDYGTNDYLGLLSEGNWTLLGKLSEVEEYKDLAVENGFDENTFVLTNKN